MKALAKRVRAKRAAAAAKGEDEPGRHAEDAGRRARRRTAEDGDAGRVVGPAPPARRPATRGPRRSPSGKRR